MKNDIRQDYKKSTVASTLIHMGALMIASVSSLYNQVCSLDTEKRK